VKLLTPDQIRRIYDATDSLGINRQWVVVPLGRSTEGREMVLPDGRVFIGVPEEAAFEAWIAGLQGRLGKLDLSRTPPGAYREPVKLSLLAEAPPGSEGPPFSYAQNVKPGR